MINAVTEAIREAAKEVLNSLQQLDPKKYQKVLTTLGLMETNLRHHLLKTHKYSSLAKANGEEVLVALCRK